MAAAAAPDVPELTEVLVTAQRRAERLQTVPISASILAGEALERARITTLDQVQFSVPNLTNGPANATRNALNLGIRGLAPRDNRPTVDPTVGVYLDEVYLGRMLGVNPALLDLERVEVLRGPQGTLFGRNTIGGAVNLISRKPGATPEARLKLTLGNYDLAALDGVLNAPWHGGRHAFRLATSVVDRSGFATTSLGADLDDEHLAFGRFQYRFAPHTNWDLNLAIDYSDSRSGALRPNLFDVDPSAVNLPAAFGNPGDNLARYIAPYARYLPVDATGPVRAQAGGFSAVVTVTSNRTMFKSISSYRWIESSAFNSDRDATPYDLTLIAYRIDDQHQVSQELQALGTALDGRLEWIGGLHYFREAGLFRQRVRNYVPGIANWNETLPHGDARNRAAAGYAQASFRPRPHWTLAVGARYNREGRQLTSQSASINGGLFACSLSVSVRDDPAICRATLPERTFSFIPWSVSIGFEPNVNAHYYLKRGIGIRSGGYNINGTGLRDLTTFEPERVTTEEVGIKQRWVDRGLQLHLAVFRSHFDDIQVSERDATNTGAAGRAVLRNGGEARIDGAELELSARLGVLRAIATYGRTKARFTRLNPRVQEVTLASKFLQSPEHTASVAIEAPLRLSWGDVTLHADYGWRSATWFDYPPDTTARQQDFGLVNTQLTVRPMRGAVTLSVWARNLTDERYRARASEGTALSLSTPGDPRTIGLALQYEWRPRAASP